LLLLIANPAAPASPYWLIIAMRTGESAVVAPFCYFIILCEVLAGFLGWQEVPALASCLGSAATRVDRDLSAPPAAGDDQHRLE
jgi:hypothetical protein